MRKYPLGSFISFMDFFFKAVDMETLWIINAQSKMAYEIFSFTLWFSWVYFIQGINLSCLQALSARWKKSCIFFFLVPKCKNTLAAHLTYALSLLP